MEWLIVGLGILICLCCILSIVNYRQTNQLFHEQQKMEMVIAVKELLEQERHHITDIVTTFKEQHQLSVQQINAFIQEEKSNLDKKHEETLTQMSKATETISVLFEQHKQHLNKEHDATAQRLVQLNNESKQQVKELVDNLVATHASTYTNMIKHHAEKIQDVTNYIVQEVHIKMNQLSEDIRQRIDVYIEQEKKEIENWKKTVQNYRSNHPLAIELLESALNKYPSSRELIDEYCFHIKAIIQSSTSATRKQAIERYNRAARVFLDNCSLQDWNFAKELMDDALKLGNEYINDIEQIRYKKALESISNLEQKTSQLKAGRKLTESEIDELERIDQSVDKKFIDHHQELKERYISASQKFMRYFSNIQDDEAVIKQYNLKALRSIDEAHRTFKLNEKGYKQGNEISRLVNLLGGWDSNLLQPATQIYFQSVYSDIFSKLNPEVKPVFTEKILKISKKAIS